MCCLRSAWDDGPYYGTDPQPHYNPALDPANFHNPKVEISPQPNNLWGIPENRSDHEGEGEARRSLRWTKPANP